MYWTIFLSVLLSSIALCGGYQINEQGARAVGMGGAFVARASDPSAIYYNPAGLAFQKGINVMGGGTFIFPSTTFSPTTNKIEKKQISQTYFPANLYGTLALDDQWVVGIGVFTPYGLGTEWSHGWFGNSSAIRTSLQTFYINPTVSYKVNDDLSIGVGISYVYATVFMSTSPLGGSVGKMELSGSGRGVNINAGALYKPMEDLSVGISYRMKTNIDFSGDVKTLDLGSPDGTWLTGPGKTTLPMPGNLMIGVAYDVLPKLTIEGDLQFIQWSAYQQLKIEIPTAIVSQGVKTFDKKWNNAFAGKLGAEYQYNKELTLRSGIVFDKTPQPADKMEPMLPDANRLDLSLGMGYMFDEQLSVDFAYMLVLFSERKSEYIATGTVRPDMTGLYKSNAFLFGIDVCYKF
jgi:long-chain fatty acid transport protein